MMLHLARRLAGSAVSSSAPGGSPGRAVVAFGRLLPAGRSIASSSCAATNIGSHMSDNDPQALAHHKEKALKGETPASMPEVEGWSETLASVSEAVVKAERYVDTDATRDPKKLELLQKQTIEVVQQLHHTGEEGMPGPPKRSEQDVSASPAHSANLEHMRNAPGSDPR
ncbi:hypothetical protein PLESTB_001468700 [Pleodorina starrii]|uniref:Uncharacterized protein n=1 Tax=Pleodorina starrii TaxID=330485 RepID=A0A9W6BXB3_9CHLO|nr:hypothetical protein PLESTM_001687000 [Pleodorina starrii]GLC59271.1 hypothetical protein PLESTB_001468700 [Pleodorina starrii]GLC74836.1 hypothetical protein PLESTF_001561300 [Pleodorina starrii]